MTRIDDELRLSVSAAGSRQDRTYSAAAVAAVLDGGPRSVERTTVTATYSTPTNPGAVYYTSLTTGGVVITARTQTGVSYSSALGLWKYSQAVSGITDFVAVWDEGDPADFVSEWIVVDT